MWYIRLFWNSEEHIPVFDVKISEPIKSIFSHFLSFIRGIKRPASLSISGSRVVRPCDLECGDCEFKTQSLPMMPRTKTS